MLPDSFIVRVLTHTLYARADVAENVFRTYVRPKSLHDHVKWALEESVGAKHAFSLMAWARSKYPHRT